MLIVLAATCLATLAWVYLLAGHGWYWLTDQRLPSAGAVGRSWPAVVAIVPARDEAATLPDSLPTLLTQDYQGALRVVLVDDESTDATARLAMALHDHAHEAAAQAAGQAAPGHRTAELTIVSGTPTPPGWAGKVWAMEQGFRAAGDADYVLFTDADIAYAPGTLSRLVAAAEASGRVLVSQMALLRTLTFAERLLVPAFVYFFAQLYPFRRVNSRRSRTAAAAGGCMLVRRTALAAAGGLAPIAAARIDDVALGALLKRAGGDCWLGFTTAVVSHRRYGKLADVWNMVARSAYTQLRYSALALVGTVVALAWLYVLPVAATVAGLLVGGATGTALAATGLVGWLMMSLTYLPVLRLCGLSALRAPSLPLVAALYATMTVNSAWRHYRGRGGEWKGRVIQLSNASGGGQEQTRLRSP